jgi:hypothetical protein
MAVRTIVALPEFDTGQYTGREFYMGEGDARLTVHAGAPFRIQFRRVRWHQFTALYNCTEEMIEGSYFTLSEVIPSPALDAYVRGDTASLKAYSELHHYRIFLDETGCHEVFAESVTTDFE